VHNDGHGWGLFGADDRWNKLDLPRFASDPRAQADLAAATLATNRRTLGNWLDAVNAYGPAAGRPAYGADVFERAEFLASLGEKMTPVEIIRAAMADLEAEGFDVVFVDGWEGRTVGGTFEPQGFLFHHTATSSAARGDYPSLGIVRDGVWQSSTYFLPGPLSQFGGGRSGTIYVIAAGKANHAGPGGWSGLSGNASVWGCELENNGIGEPWPARQVEASIALAAALARHSGFGAESCCRHAEWSSAGKIDTATAPMNDGNWLRARVAERLAGGPPVPPPTPPEEDDMATPHILLTYGSGVALWHTSGKVVPLGSTKQVLDFLALNPVVMDDLNADQIDKIVGAGTAEMLATAPDLAHLLPTADPLSCAGADG
jgi:hypothetical protein